jgi:hypothetical protein
VDAPDRLVKEAAPAQVIAVTPLVARASVSSAKAI